MNPVILCASQPSIAWIVRYSGHVSHFSCDTSRQPALYLANRAILWPAGARRPAHSCTFFFFGTLWRLARRDFLPLCTGA